MNIGLFGGTFDPIHRGHVALATAAEEKFKLRQLHFVPANVPPHKQTQPLTPYLHRFTMLSLATSANKNWIPSLLEAPEEPNGLPGKKKTPDPNYSIDTVRRNDISAIEHQRVNVRVAIYRGPKTLEAGDRSTLQVSVGYAQTSREMSEHRLDEDACDLSEQLFPERHQRTDLIR